MPKKRTKTAKTKKRVRLPTIAKLKRIAHDIWSHIVRERDPVCRICNNAHTAQAHHSLGKRIYPSLRYDIAVGIGVCRRCHIIVHASPLINALAHSETETHALLLKATKATTPKWTRQTMNGIVAGLERIRDGK